MSYQILLLPMIAMLVAQGIKLFIRSNNKKITLKDLASYSGMPSGHSAIVVSLAAIVGLTQGWESPHFAISAILAIIVIRDALGIRRYLGEHGQILNKLVKDLKDDQVLDETYPKLLERIGHTPLQVAVGSMIGFLVSLVGFLILN